MIKCLVTVCIFTLTVAPNLQAQKYEKGLIDKTIAIIGGEAIILSQLESEIQMMMAQGVTSDRNLRCEVLENMLVQKLFLNQARLDS